MASGILFQTWAAPTIRTVRTLLMEIGFAICSFIVYVHALSACSDFLRLGVPLFCAAESEEQQDAKRLADTLTGRTFAATIDKLMPVSSSSSLSVTDVSPASSDITSGNVIMKLLLSMRKITSTVLQNQQILVVFKFCCHRLSEIVVYSVIFCLIDIIL